MGVSTMKELENIRKKKKNSLIAHEAVKPPN